MHICDICCVGIICFCSIVDCIVIFIVFNFWKSPIYCRYTAGFSFGTNKNLIFLRIFFTKLVGYFCRNMSVGSAQRRV